MGFSHRTRPNLSWMLRQAALADASGEFGKAQRLYGALLEYEPDNFDALHGLGQLHCRNGRLDTALLLFQAAVKADRGRTEGFASLGLVFHLLRRFKEALLCYDEGLGIASNNQALLNRRGVAQLELGRTLEALESFDRVLAIAPTHVDALGNRGNTLLKLNRPAEALADYDAALKITPENAQLLTNRAVALRRLDRPQEAAISARRALVSAPDFAEARFVEAVARLTMGDFAAGWQGYEARWSVGLLAGQRRSFTAPLWLGQASLKGKTILLHAEQGFGDTLQFVRYVRLIAAFGAERIIVEVQAELVRLLACMPGVAAVVARGTPLPPFDFHCPLLSLPLAFATDLATMPASIPYIAPAPDQVRLWRGRLPRRRPLVGLAWSGAPRHDNDLNRSLPLETLKPLLDRSDAAYVSLQHDVRDGDVALLHAQDNVLAIGTQLQDFADTAAVVASLDAVVSVDTAVAHLAGAMGKPLFILLPFAADFRWLRERRNSPWYPSARLYRQPKFGDWQGAIASLHRDLTQPSFWGNVRKLSA